ATTEIYTTRHTLSLHDALPISTRRRTSLFVFKEIEMNTFTDNFTINGITLTAQPICRQDEVLTPDALEFVAKLHRATAVRRQEVLQARRTRRAEIAAGQDPRFLRETEDIRNDPSWRV